MPFKVYRSSAGSGKTFTLVKEYLTIALGSEKVDAYKGILAITFTNKAAEEMKARVLDALSKIAAAEFDSNPLGQVLLQELKTDRQILSRRATNVLRHMLHHYSDVSISTIDRFSHRIIRTFSQDLQLSVNFEVELETKPLIQKVLDELMDKVGVDKMLTTALLDFLDSSVDEEKSWTIDKKIKDYIEVLFREESRFHLQRLQTIELAEFYEVRQRLQQIIKPAKQELISIGKSFLRELKKEGLTIKDLSYGKSGIAGYYLKLAEGKVELPGQRSKATVENETWYTAKTPAEIKGKIDLLIPGFKAGFERARELIPTVIQLDIVFKHIYGVALLDEMYRILQEVQEEEEILHIGEFNHLINDIVLTESAPFLYERLGSKFSHFLVDEFQDTSVLQWFNLLPLIDESLAKDNLCLVVGDAKQSIYRWRGGDVRQFVALPSIYKPPHIAEKLAEDPHLSQLFETRERVLNRTLQEKPLAANYRSKSTIVQFNNDLFSFLEDRMPEQHSVMYKNSAQEITKAEDGFISINLFRQPQGVNSWPEYDQLVLEKLGLWVEETLSDNYHQEDIAVIVRSNRDAVKIALYLIEKGYHVVSNESLLISSSRRVRLMVNIANLITDPNNATNILELIENLARVNSSFGDLQNQLMSVKGGKKPSAIWNLLGDAYPDVKWAKLSAENPFMLFSILAEKLFPHSTEPHITFFLDEVLANTQSKRKSLHDFLAYWEEEKSKLSISLVENQGAINIMTVHKSKGLEFPVVMHPFADYPTKNTLDPTWTYLQDKQFAPIDRLRIPNSKALETTDFAACYSEERDLNLMDMFNELYVATTRAKERLYFSGKLGTNPKSDSNTKTATYCVKSFLNDISSENTDKLDFTFGKRTKATTAKATLTNLTLSQTGDTDWQSRISVASPPKPYVATASEADARLRGIAVHDALASIQTADDIEQSIKTLVEEGRINEVERESIGQHIRNLLETKPLAPLFSEGVVVRNEADLLLDSGKWLRPDRVVLKDDNAWVLDYKTGQQRPEHREQINEYKRAMNQLGFSNVEGMLIYLDSEEIVHV